MPKSSHMPDRGEELCCIVALRTATSLTASQDKQKNTNGCRVSGSKANPSILAGAGRAAPSTMNDAAALRLLEDQKHLFKDWSSVKSLEKWNDYTRPRPQHPGRTRGARRAPRPSDIHANAAALRGRDEQSESIGRLDAVRAARRSARSPFGTMARHGRCSVCGKLGNARSC